MPVLDDLLSGLLDLTASEGAGLTRRLTEGLRTMVASGRLAPGTSLPSSRRLAEQLGLSRNTVTQAIEQLASEGYLKVLPNRRPRIASNMSLPFASPDDHTAADPQPPLPSAWGQHLSELAWPPRHGERPRPFQAGLGDEREFPHAAWGRCLRLAATRVPRRTGRADNDPSLQEALIAHLAARRGLRARPDQIILVPSAQAGLNLVARCVLDPGDAAWIESPGYGGAHAALRSAGANVLGIPLDANGLTIPRSVRAPRLVVVTPSHQYPTGRLMSVGRRLDLLAFAREMGATIVEDDYDGEFHYEGRPVAALAGLDLEGAVFYVGTLSKIMSADIRVGYVVAPEPLLPTIRLAQRHLGLLVPAAMQVALAEFIASGNLLTHIRRMTRLYRDRRDRLVKALHVEAGSRLALEVPAGGMQLLARCGIGIDDAALCRSLKNEGVVARPLSEMHYHHTEEMGLFLGFSAWDREQIERGAEVIGRLLRKLA